MTANYFIDSHCHLDFLERDGIDLAGVIERAQSVGVKKFLTIATNMAIVPTLLSYTEKFADVYASIGVHPHDSDIISQKGEADASYDNIVAQTKHPKVIGIGESGLDFFYDHSDRNNQEESFRRHLSACCATDLPIIVHSRSADTKTIEILKSESQNGKLRGVIHCFSSGEELAYGALDLGFYISLSGILTFPKAEDIRQIVKNIPVERLLLETDAPYLAPVPHRGKKNEPSLLPETAKLLAEIKNISLEEIMTATTKNFYQLFRKATTS